MICDFDTNVESVKETVSVPNRRTAQAIRKKLIYEMDWVQLHSSYPSARSMKATQTVTDTYSIIQHDQLKTLLNRLNTYTPNELETLMTNENNQFKKTTVANITTDKSLRQTWRTIRSLMDTNKNQSIVSSIEDEAGNRIKGDKMEKALIDRYYEMDDLRRSGTTRQKMLAREPHRERKSNPEGHV